MEQLIALILKVAKEQGYCFPGNKVMIFTVENEGKANETAAFRMIDIDEEWMNARMNDWEEINLKTKNSGFKEPTWMKYTTSTAHLTFIVKLACNFCQL